MVSRLTPLRARVSAWSHALRREHALHLASLFCFLFVAVSLLVNPLRVNYDVATAISIARLLINGATPYVDYVNLNPPLIHYLHVIPAWIAVMFGINPIITFSWGVLGLTAWTVFVISQLSRALEQERAGRLIGAVVVFTIALLTLKLAAYNALGQREHIFVLLFLPYALLRWLRLHRHRDVHRYIPFVVGVLGGIGICLKPHFLIIWLALEAYLILGLRSLRKTLTPELVAALLTGLVYAAHFVFLPQEVRDGIREVLSMLSSGGYKAYGDHSPIEIITSDLKTISIALAPFVLVRDEHGELGGLLRLAGVLAMASLAEAALQARGFFYHGIPSWAWIYLIVLLAIFGHGTPVQIFHSPIQGRRSLTLRVQHALKFAVYGLLVLAFVGWADILSPPS